MIIDGERSLAYIVMIDELKPLPGYDRVQYARTNGWWVVVPVNAYMKVGAKCVYFEIDSKLPETDERFAFMKKYKYRVRTQRMCHVVSQGLLMSVSEDFPELEEFSVGEDVTNLLNVTYYVPSDNERKAKSPIRQGIPKAKSVLFKIPIFNKIRIAYWNKKLDKAAEFAVFPDFVDKTDEERCENIPDIVDDKGKWIATEKLDGTSATYAMKRLSKKRREFYVCSRNIRLKEDGSAYWAIAKEEEIYFYLNRYLEDHKECDWVAIQGEIIGPGIQGNWYGLEHPRIYVFNFIDSENGRWPSQIAYHVVRNFGMNFVPIIGMSELPHTMEELKKAADGQSVIADKMREGIVYRSWDGKRSFKNVSNKYLERKTKREDDGS